MAQSCVKSEKSIKVLRNSIATLRNLTAHHVVALQLRTAGLVSNLVELCEKTRDNSVVAHTAGALANMCRIETNTSKLMQGGVVWCGGMTTLLKLCRESKIKAVLLQVRGLHPVCLMTQD